MTQTWINFLVNHKFARGTHGILRLDDVGDFQNYLQRHAEGEAYYCVFDLVEEELKVEVDTGAVTPSKQDPSKMVPVYKYITQAEARESGVEIIPPYLQMQANVEGRLTTKNYEGPARPAFDLVEFDFDHSEDAAIAHRDALAFIEWTGVFCQLAFSGSKGFHVAVPLSAFGLEVDEQLPKYLHDLVVYLKEFYKTLDTSVFNANRKFRVLNSQHPKTNLWKTLVPTTYSMEEILATAATRHGDKYIRGDQITAELSPTLSQAMEQAKKFHEYDKAKAGDRDQATKFEGFDGKLCIKRLIENRCADGEKNTTALIIINDLYKTGKSYNFARDVVEKWSQDNNDAEGTRKNFEMLDDIYNGRKYYNHGCQDPIKAANCSAKCPLWPKLDTEKRPVPVDAPKSAYKEETKKKKLPARFFIEGYLTTNMVTVDLASNWAIRGKYADQAYLEDLIYCEALDRKALVDPCSKQTISAYLSTWLVDERERLLGELQKFIRHEPLGIEDGDELEFWVKAVKRDADAVDIEVMRHWVWQVKRKIFGLPVHNHIMPIFAGLTGSGKSEAIRRLISPLQVVSLTTDLKIMNDERENFNLIEKFIIFFDEMAKAEQVDVNTLKNKITLDYASYRKLGTNARVKGPNRASFIGASNPSVVDIIKDPTSARRFYELAITEVGDWESVNGVDVVKLWKSVDENEPLGYMVGDTLAEVRKRQELIRDRDSVEEWLDYEELRPAADTKTTHWAKALDAYKSYMAFMEMQKRERYSVSILRFGRIIKRFVRATRKNDGTYYEFSKNLAAQFNQGGRF